MNLKTVLRKIQEKPFSFLVTMGPHGSLFLQSLLDGHPQVLTVPTFMNYMSFYDRFGSESHGRLSSELRSRTMFQVIARKENTAKGGDFRELAFDADCFREKFEAGLDLSEKNHRGFLHALHAAYAIATSKDVDQVKNIFVHNHYPEPYDLIRYYWPEAMFYVMMRNPKGTVSSYHRTIKENFGGYVPSYLILQKLRSMLASWEQAERSFIHDPYCTYMRLEDLHSNLAGVAQRLCDDLKLDDCPELYESTLGGQPYICTSASNKNVQGSSPRVTSPAWTTDFPPEFTRFVESFAGGIMRRHGYEFEAQAPMSLREMADYRFPDERVLKPVHDAQCSFQRTSGRLPERTVKTALDYARRLRRYKAYNLPLSLTWNRRRLMERAVRFRQTDGAV